MELIMIAVNKQLIYAPRHNIRDHILPYYLICLL